jgi:D-glycero-D-manno-heptose 1,7-bisphosphate phosphatase
MSTAAHGACAVFLDRDGVLNRSEVRDGKAYAPRRLEEFKLLPGVPKAVRALKEAGYLLIVATNQPDIGNGKVDPAIVAAMHERLRRLLPVDDIAMCPHRQDENCPCRKPKAGMLTAAAQRFHIDLSRSFMVGDRWSDVVAGRTAGCYTVFVNRGYREDMQIAPDATVSSLPAAARLILSRPPKAITGAKNL